MDALHLASQIVEDLRVREEREEDAQHSPGMLLRSLAAHDGSQPLSFNFRITANHEDAERVARAFRGPFNYLDMEHDVCIAVDESSMSVEIHATAMDMGQSRILYGVVLAVMGILGQIPA